MTHKAAILSALDAACKIKFEEPYGLLSDPWMDSDDKAARYGVRTRTVASMASSTTGCHVSLPHVRRILNEELIAGRMFADSNPGASIRWWPVGMLAQLKAGLAQRSCNACAWRGVTDRMLGGVGPLCPECGETTELAA